MRTIDADHLKSMLHEYVKREQSYIDIGNNRSVAMGHRNGLLEAITQIAEEPTIEPQRIKGRWINNCRCSECGYSEKNYSDAPNNFCPVCGADMREE